MNASVSNNNIAVISDHYNKTHASSMGSLDKLTQNGVNPSFMGSQGSIGPVGVLGSPSKRQLFGSQMSVGGMSNFSYESGV